MLFANYACLYAVENDVLIMIAGFVFTRKTGNETWVPCRACPSVQDSMRRVLNVLSVLSSKWLVRLRLRRGPILGLVFGTQGFKNGSQNWVPKEVPFFGSLLIFE